ncbi:MAG: ATP synthase F1 subunit epsilon [Candidatus Marinimicrobia bacterium]|nr:ATP synthase F1 subunit epsilon [Candidatus Neomarinimicrobiota bacterium]|tara:strand:- start:463 stop:861 length:399 start_codon:yes stop_codon:yes gene_type:complete
MSEFQLEIVTPTKLLDIGSINYVRCPGLDGSFGVLANHQAAIIALGIGEIKIAQNKKFHYFATSGGFIEITEEKVQLLVETVERAEDIDMNRAEEALKRSKQRGKEKDASLDEARRDISVTKALNRLRVSKR